MRLANPVLACCLAALALAACDGGKADESDTPDADPSAAAAGQPVAKPAFAEAPSRKLGLWEHAISSSGHTVKAKYCLDQATEKKLAWWGPQMADDSCTNQQLEKLPDGSWSFASSCQIPGGRTAAMSGVAKGDFQSKYTIQLDTQLTADGKTQGIFTVIDATWQGACPQGMRGGDVQGPDGVVRNLLDSQNAQKEADLDAEALKMK